MSLQDFETLVPSVGAFAAAAALIFNALTYLSNARARDLQTITSLDQELTNLEASPNRNLQFPLWGAEYLALNERIAFLTLTKIIPHKFARYFDRKFSGCLGLLEIPSFAKLKPELQNLIEWCRLNSLRIGPAPLPFAVVDQPSTLP